MADNKLALNAGWDFDLPGDELQAPGAAAHFDIGMQSSRSAASLRNRSITSPARLLSSEAADFEIVEQIARPRPAFR